MSTFMYPQLYKLPVIITDAAVEKVCKKCGVTFTTMSRVALWCKSCGPGEKKRLHKLRYLKRKAVGKR